MKRCFVILIVLFICQVLTAQESFFDLYSQVLLKADAYSLKYGEINADKRTDSIQKKKLLSKEFTQYRNNVKPLLDKVTNQTFPDISFTDINGKAYAISDFKQEIVVNYNYMYCASCMARIDETLKKLNNRQVKMLVLFAEMYRKDYPILKVYPDPVLVGFINDDTKDLISFNQGDDCMYYLDETRRIECFDQRDSEAWIKFLNKNKL